MYTVPVPLSKINNACRNQIGEAIYLLAYLIQIADWRTGKAVVSMAKIVEETEFPYETVRRWMRVLRSTGEINVRRTRTATVFTINDYDAIANTRHVPRVSSVSKSPGMNDDENCQCSEMNTLPFTDEQSDCSEMNSGLFADERLHLLQNISQNHVQNLLQNLLQSIPAEKKEKGKALFDNEPAAEAELREAKIAVETLDVESRQSLMIRAMEEMESDRRPFVRIFVRRNEQGELVPAVPLAMQAILKYMAAIFARESSEVSGQGCPETTQSGSG